MPFSTEKETDEKPNERMEIIGPVISTKSKLGHDLMYLHSAELNVVAVTENVNTFLLV